MIRRIQESEEKYRNFMEGSLQGLWIHVGHRIMFCNQVLASMFGYDNTEELIGLNLVETLVAPPDRDRVIGYYSARLQGQSIPERYEFQGVRKNGETIWVKIFASLTQWEGIRGAQGALIDITERKQAEAKLRNNENQLRRLSHRQSLILGHAGDGIYGLDADGKTAFANRAALTMLGYDLDDMLDKSQHDIIHHTKPDGSPYPREECPIYMAFRDGKVHRVADEVFWRKDGSQFPVEYVSTPIEEEGKLTGAVVIFQDITERKRAGEELARHRNQLEEIVEERTKELEDTQEQLVRREKLAVLGQLAGGVGHELRNPLGAIKNAAYFLNMVLEKPEPDVKETLEVLNNEVVTSERIIGSLLDFARPKAPTRQKAEINDLVQRALVRASVPENIETVTRLDETLAPILTDPDQVSQVFGNIILNAIQAMPEGGRLEVKSEVPTGGWVAVSFSDSGAGIPQENLAKLFEPLFTTKARGIGLGLALTKTLVEGQGGTIEVSSEVGRGSTFTVRLPAGSKEQKTDG